MFAKLHTRLMIRLSKSEKTDIGVEMLLEAIKFLKTSFLVPKQTTSREEIKFNQFDFDIQMLIQTPYLNNIIE